MTPWVPPGFTNRPIMYSAAPTIVRTTPSDEALRLQGAEAELRAHRRDGRDPRRRGERGSTTEPIVMPMPTSAAITTVRGSITMPVDGNPAPAALKPATSSLATSDAAGEAEDRGGQAQEERLDGDHPPHLPARRADGAHQRQFPQPLTDRDLEDVVDDEGADEGGDEREDQQALCRTRR